MMDELIESVSGATKKKNKYNSEIPRPPKSWRKWRISVQLDPLQSMEIHFAKCKRFTVQSKSDLHYSYMVEEQNKAVDIDPCMHFRRTNFYIYLYISMHLQASGNVFLHKLIPRLVLSCISVALLYISNSLFMYITHAQ